jgi:hypothetical protein
MSSVGVISNRFCATPDFVQDWFTCKSDVNKERLDYAYKEYLHNIDKFAILLDSKNPDHYKRAGALLHALYQSEIIVSSELINGIYGSPDDLETGFTLVSHGGAQHILKFANFYQEYYNQVFCFDMAYRCCAAYEDNPRGYNFDYLLNVCRYLKVNTNLTVDSLFMLFKSLMQ